MERREEIEAYVGPNAAAYRGVFARFAPGEASGGTPGFAFSWNWPAFFCGVWWYLYRKMYLWAAVDFVLSVVSGWTFFVPLVWAIARAVTGNYLYFLQADKKIRESRALSAGAGGGGGGDDGGAPDPAHLRRLASEGGVHRWVAWGAVVGIVLLLLLSSFFFHLLWEMIPVLRDNWPPGGGTWT